MLEMLIYTMFAIVSMMRITGVEISNKPKCKKTNSNFEKFRNVVNLIYTLCAMLEMMIQTMFAIVRKMRLTGVEVSNTPKCAKTNRNFEKFRNVVNLIYTLCAMLGIMI